MGCLGVVPVVLSVLRGCLMSEGGFVAFTGMGVGRVVKV